MVIVIKNIILVLKNAAVVRCSTLRAFCDQFNKAFVSG